MVRGTSRSDKLDPHSFVGLSSAKLALEETVD